MKRSLSALLVASVVVACARPDGESGSVDEAGTSVSGAAGAIDSEIAESGSGMTTSPSSAAPLTAFEPEGRTELRTYRLLLVNPRSIQAVVYADAGAELVLLDTVSRLDSSRVDVEVRAARLRLTVTDRWGERLEVASLDLRPDTVNRWALPADPILRGDSSAGGG